MKKRLQGLITGVLIGATITGGAAFAANTITLYDVLMNGIKIVVDGQQLNPTDANGNKVEPIIYNGTTYLPVRAVANAIGKAVYWDGPNFTVYLGKMDGKLEYPTIKIEDMVNIGEGVSQRNYLTDNYGNRYERAIDSGGYGYTAEYLLNMKYSRFKGTLYVPEGESDNNESYLTIEADGRTIYSSPAMTKNSAPVNIDIDVTGYNHIKISFNKKDWNDLWLCLGNAGFYQ